MNSSNSLFNPNINYDKNIRNICNINNNKSLFSFNLETSNFKRGENRKKTYDINNALTNNIYNANINNNNTLKNNFDNLNFDKINNINKPIKDNFIYELKNY